MSIGTALTLTRPAPVVTTDLPGLAQTGPYTESPLAAGLALMFGGIALYLAGEQAARWWRQRGERKH